MNKKYYIWGIIALIFVVLVASILALFKAEEGWLGFWGGIIGSAIGVLGAFLVLKEQVNSDRDALKEQLNEEREQNRKQQIDNTFFNLLSMHNEQINSLKEEKKFEKIYKELRSKLINKMHKSCYSYLRNHKDIIPELNNLKLIYEEYINKHERKISGAYMPAYESYWKREHRKITFTWLNDPFLDCIADAVDAILLIEDIIDTIKDVEKTDSGIIDKFKYLENYGKAFEIERTEMWNTLYNRILEYQTNNFTLIDEDLRKAAVEDVLSRHYNEVGAYFRLFHRIIKYINDNLERPEELPIKNNYLGFLRATLNSKEMLVIFYNAAYTNRGAGLLKELQKTTFFGIEEDLKSSQHFNISDLFWEEDDLNKMLNQHEDNTVLSE
ncbi:hypothetical protein SSM_02771 [Enterococcus faecium EnGen0192]|uniref:Phage abortive infection protein n=1 Tax=Enterococcus faecium EnGen0192 TaxID=1157487 RepID=A0A829FEG9_ENTFC|nr:putative phage abortive infection protein [Enterococcus faecium]EOM09759.1 hypothetical protein U9W_02175 [Enterococcus faecium EnGen0261]EOM19169.1 hypothetical protein SSM_02771 [Enterococcus faecium EnGen0192]